MTLKQLLGMVGLNTNNLAVVDGYNVNPMDSITISDSKLMEIVEVDREELADILHIASEKSKFSSLVNWERLPIEIQTPYLLTADALIQSKSKWLKIRKG